MTDEEPTDVSRYHPVRATANRLPSGEIFTPEDNFCPSCASPLKMKDVSGKDRPVCSKCVRVIYYDPKIAAISIIPRDGKVLMIQRATDLGYGLWGLPGGYVDRGEVVEEAAIRETLEETGLVVEVKRLVGLFSEPEETVIVAAFATFESGGTLKPGPEALDADFFLPGDLPALAFPRDTEILARWAEGERLVQPG